MSHFWPELEQWLIGERISGDAGGLDVSVQAAWSVPPGLVALVLIFTAAVMLLVYWHESQSASRSWKILLSGIRTALVGIVLLMLFGWTVQQHRTDLPDVVVILDDSASMGVVDGGGDASLSAAIKQRLASATLDEPTRLNLAKTLLLENKSNLLSELAGRYNLRCYLAGGSARALGGPSAEVATALRQVAADQPASRLGECLRDCLELQRGKATAAVIMLTDGVTTDGKSLSDAAQQARRQSVPLFLIGLGSDRPRRDLRLADLLTDEAAFVGDLLHFDARLVSEGFSGEAMVRLKLAGQATPLAEEKVLLAKDGAMQAVRLTHRADKRGEFEYVVEIVPRDGESEEDNNRLARKVVVRDEIIRVLLVQAHPSYEFRFLKQMLMRQLNAGHSAESKAAAFRTVLQEADLAYGDSDKTAERTFPASREELFQFDVLIFGDVNPALLSRSIMNNIYEFVTARGGGLIFVAGPRYTPHAYRDTPLAPLMPMNIATVGLPDSDALVADSFRPRLTPLGVASPTMQLVDSAAENEKLWHEALTPIRWLVAAPDLLPGVRVLAEHPTRRTDRGELLPVICLQFIGAGKVVYHATDETHRWRFRVGDAYFARYWMQTIRYLCRAKLLSGSRSVELVSDRREYRLGDAVNLRVRFFDDRVAPAEDNGVMVVVEREAGERRTVSLHRHSSDRGVFEGVAGSLSAGQYRAWVAAPALAGAAPSQRFSFVAPPGELARTQMDATELREAAKISAGKFYTIETAGRLLAELPRGRQVRIESLPPKPIWNAPILATLFIALITTEWLLRRRLGLL